MSVFGDFQRVWMQRFPESALPAAWEEDVRANLSKHKQKVAILREELEKEEFYVEYLERLLLDVEKHKTNPLPIRTAPPPPEVDDNSDKEKINNLAASENTTDKSLASEEQTPDPSVISVDEEEVILRQKTSSAIGHRNSINQCISELSSSLSEQFRRCTSELPQKTEVKEPELATSPKPKVRPASQGGGDFVTVIEVNGLKKVDGKPKKNDEQQQPRPLSPSGEAVPSKRRIPPRPPPKAFQKRGGSLPDPPSDDSPPASLGVPTAAHGKLQGAESRESLVSHSSSHGTPSITERVKSYESINSLSSERKRGGAGTPLSAAAPSDSLEGAEGSARSAPLSLESIPNTVALEAVPKEEPFYDSVPLDGIDGEYVYIQAGGTSSSTDDVSSNSSTLPLAARAPLAHADPPESPGNNSNYVNIDYFIQRGVGRTDTQRSAGSADSEGDGEPDPAEVSGGVATSGLVPPLLLRSISTDPEGSAHVPFTPRKFQHQESAGNNVEAERLTMHRCIVSSIIESETVYVECLYVMEKYMNAIKATLNSSQPVITEEEFNTIFYKISELHDLHKSFLKGLQKDVQSYEEPLAVGIHFKKMAENINIYGAFLHNYGCATGAVRKCCTSSLQFRDLTQHIACRGQPMSLEDLLHKPVARVQKNALVLHDLLKYTPLSHPDHAMLTDALNMTQRFLDEFNFTGAHRRLAKNSFIVELADAHRKLRHLFLFNDVLACAKYKASGREKFTFELKWFIPLQDIVVYEDPAAEPKEASPPNIVSLKSQACTVRDQILMEEKALDDKKLRLGANRVADKHRKKLADLEGQLVKASPNLVFRVGSKSTQRIQTFFLSSDFERTQWIDSIHSLQSSAPPSQSSTSPPSMMDLQAHVKACRSYLDSEIKSSYLMRSSRDESLLLGDLHLNIGEIMKPLETPADMYVCVEVDSYGHYFRKAKSRLVCHSPQPKWNETYVIELEGSQHVRVLLYEDSGGLRPQLRGKCTLELSRQWLGEQQCFRTLTLGTSSMTIWMRFVPSEVTLRRVPTAKPGGLFGAKIQQVCKRQKRDIPFIVTSCVREVDRRGMSEVGLYRVSGSASDLSKLKKSFETNSYEAEQLLKEVDIHSVTGILKLYLRELPEALFTDALYPKFFQAFSVQGGQGGGGEGVGSTASLRQRELQKCYEMLPDYNRKCIDFLLGHFIRVNQHESENKMSLHNLATVFGPTLLRPSVRPDAAKQRDLLAAGTVDVMAQAGILYCLLQHRHLSSRISSSNKDAS